MVLYYITTKKQEIIMNTHDDPDDIEYSKAMELQMRKISDE